MTVLHVVGSVVSFVAAGMLTVGAGIAAFADRGHDAVRRLTTLVVGVFAVEAALGLVLIVSGRAPTEGLHFLYGAGLVAAIPLALRFASEAPDRARSAVLAVAGLATLLLAWRLLATG